jgi:uncharacterized protein YhaN
MTPLSPSASRTGVAALSDKARQTAPTPFDAAGRSADADVLSQGTTEQFFLLLRIALAMHLSKADETVPLVLDDVTVQSDPERTRAILELLHRLSTERQVVLFTQEPAVVQWATENLAAKAVISLP